MGRMTTGAGAGVLEGSEGGGGVVHPDNQAAISPKLMASCARFVLAKLVDVI